MSRNEVEDGMGFGGLLPIAEDKHEKYLLDKIAKLEEENEELKRALDRMEDLRNPCSIDIG